jgi:hypothetical protein
MPSRISLNSCYYPRPGDALAAFLRVISVIFRWFRGALARSPYSAGPVEGTEQGARSRGPGPKACGSNRVMPAP